MLSRPLPHLGYNKVSTPPQISPMNDQSTYLNELYAKVVGIICSPMAFYYLLRYKLGFINEEVARFSLTVTETLKEPKSKAAKTAAMAVNIVLIDLLVFGYVYDEWFYYFLAGAIGFSLVVERMWRVEVGGWG